MADNFYKLYHLHLVSGGIRGLVFVHWDFKDLSTRLPGIYVKQLVFGLNNLCSLKLLHLVSGGMRGLVSVHWDHKDLSTHLPGRP